MLMKSIHAATLECLPAAVCIIGAGAAGITLACELDGCDFPVLLIDAGSFGRSDRHGIYTGRSTGSHPHPSEFRRVGFGGTTTIWGGRCVPLDEIDFERRSYVPESGWPISFDDVARHYPRALEYCEAGEFDFTASRSIPNAQPILPGLSSDETLVTDRIERYSRPTNFGSAYREQIAKSKNVTAVLGFRCLRVVTEQVEQRAVAAEFVDASGTRALVRATTFVLAVGGIESVRLLFASDLEGQGLGNRFDHLGRFYACHIENICGKLLTDGVEAAFGFETATDGVYVRRKIQFTEAAQRREELLNCVFRLHFPDYSDATHQSAVMSLAYVGKSLLIPEYRKILERSSSSRMQVTSLGSHLWNVSSGLPELASFASERLLCRLLRRRSVPYTLIPAADGSFPLEFNSEQTPLWSSRIRLDDERDEFGNRGVLIEWKLSEGDVQASKRAFVLFRRAIARKSACRVEFNDDELVADLRQSRPIGGHHIGTTRIASSPRKGVVDTNCAVFGCDNLYVASSATFPTSGHANPTLTIVAMTIRLGAHLARVLEPKMATASGGSYGARQAASDNLASLCIGNLCKERQVGRPCLKTSHDPSG